MIYLNLFLPFRNIWDVMQNNIAVRVSFPLTIFVFFTVFSHHVFCIPFFILDKQINYLFFYIFIG